MNRSTLTRSGGVVLHFEEHGDGPAVFFQHGLGADAAQVAEVFPAEPAVRRITLECRAQGRSDAGPLAGLSLQTFAEDVASLADHFGLKRAVVGGISMGAAVALRLAVHRPDLVSGLILARPAWLFDPAPENMRPFALLGDLLRQPDRGAARDAFLRSDTAKRLADRAPDNLSSLLAFFDRPSTPATGSLLTAIAADGPGVSHAEVARIQVPTLVLGTNDDLVHPFAYAKHLAAAIPSARLVEIASKVASRERYVAEFRSALAGFLVGFC